MMPRINSSFAVILDACVLYPAPLRDILLELSLSGLFRARWTAKIHEEWMEALQRERPEIDPAALARTRDLMDLHAEHCVIEGYEDLIAALQLPDPDDRHVLAAAIRGRVDAVVTFNRRDFPTDVLKTYGIEVIHPDDFITYQIDLSKTDVLLAARRVRARLKHPPKSPREYLDTLLKQQLPLTVSLLEAEMDSI